VFNLSPFKLMMIVAVILIFLGPDKLPQAARQIGEGWRSLKKFQQRVETEVREAIPSLPSSGDLARVVRSPVNLLNEIASRTQSIDDLGDVEDGPLPGDVNTTEAAPEVPMVGEYNPPPPPPDPSWN
jgi:Sec-independent protein translocase protein TatA